MWAVERVAESCGMKILHSHAFDGKPYTDFGYVQKYGVVKRTASHPTGHVDGSFPIGTAVTREFRNMVGAKDIIARMCLQ